MTWHMSSGDGILKPAAARLFAEAAILMVAPVDADNLDSSRSGVSAFDTLSEGQKISTLREVLRALFLKSVHAPALTAYREATIAPSRKRCARSYPTMSGAGRSPASCSSPYSREPTASSTEPLRGPRYRRVVGAGRNV